MSRDDEHDDPLERARAHFRRATIETLEAANALVEAALRSTSLASIAPDSLPGELQRSLENLIAAVRREEEFRLPRALSEFLAGALDGEIMRWQKRSESEPDARPVLRALLGLRELLWEIGVRKPSAESASDASSAADPPDSARATAQGAPKKARKKAAKKSAGKAPRKPGSKRIQRFDIEG